MSFPGKYFTIEKAQEEDIIIFRISGEFDVYTAVELKIPLHEAISEKHKKIIVDMTEVSFVDSSGLGLLIHALKHLRAYNGQIVLVVKRKDIIDIIRVTNLSQLLRIYPTIEEAAKGFLDTQKTSI